ncbi:unnamed protein product, partial [Prorocentrum cordatum]
WLAGCALTARPGATPPAAGAGARGPEAARLLAAVRGDERTDALSRREELRQLSLDRFPLSDAPAQGGGSEEAQCPHGFYREAPIVFACGEQRREVSILLGKMTIELPKGLQNLKLAMVAEGDAILTLQNASDGSSTTGVDGDSQFGDEHGNQTYTVAMAATSNGSATAVFSGTLPGGLSFDLVSSAPGLIPATVTYSYEDSGGHAPRYPPVVQSTIRSIPRSWCGDGVRGLRRSSTVRLWPGRPSASRPSRPAAPTSWARPCPSGPGRTCGRGGPTRQPRALRQRSSSSIRSMLRTGPAHRSGRVRHGLQAERYILIDFCFLRLCAGSSRAAPRRWRRLGALRRSLGSTGRRGRRRCGPASRWRPTSRRPPRTSRSPTPTPAATTSSPRASSLPPGIWDMCPGAGMPNLSAAPPGAAEATLLGERPAEGNGTVELVDTSEGASTTERSTKCCQHFSAECMACQAGVGLGDFCGTAALRRRLAGIRSATVGASGVSFVLTR